jgi:hypothetical protein
MEATILRRIFFDHRANWEKFKAKYGSRIREVVIKEVEKYRNCGDPSNGFRLFVCEGCHEIRRVPFRCKSRFCTTCSCGETEEWSRIMAEDVVQVNHRHVVLTIDEGLREIFERYRFLLKEFMDEAVRIVQDYFKQKYKVTPGIIAGLHTFGSRLNFNPHVHMLVTMGGMKETGEWKTYDFIPFAMLRKQWQTVVVKLIRRKLTEEQKKKVQPLLQTAYKANAEGFYVYAPKQKGNVKMQLRYIGRYMRRPAIGLNRIVNYDGESVTFKYQDKRSSQEKQETISVEEFIGRLIKHIPDEQFKLIRHYGIYSRRIKALSKKLIGVWQKTVRKWLVAAKRLARRDWSQRIKEQTGKDPMECPVCGCYYEYKGEVCPKDGELTVKYAKESAARDCLERMISHITGKARNAEKEEKRRETNASTPKYSPVYLFTM